MGFLAFDLFDDLQMMMPHQVCRYGMHLSTIVSTLDGTAHPAARSRVFLF